VSAPPASPADPAALARLHAQCFTTPRPWSPAEFTELLKQPGVFTVIWPQGLALGRIAAGEAELLTLAVRPGSRRQGLGRRLLAEFLDEAAVRGAEAVFLEVAADNQPARRLYDSEGFTEVGRRRGYYCDPVGARLDAVILRRGLDRR
jgi:[ribosomal protein S18]-alanine N-acetyltransferase